MTRSLEEKWQVHLLKTNLLAPCKKGKILSKGEEV